jgi:hypothetical protein
MSSRSGSVVALVLASTGFAYIVYLFALACVMLSAGIPRFEEWLLIRETGSRPEAEVFAYSCLWGLVPLAFLAALVLIVLRQAGMPEDASRSRGLRRTAVALLVLGLPLAVVAYGTWYQVGW